MPSIAEAALASKSGSSGENVAIHPVWRRNCPISSPWNFVACQNSVDKSWPRPNFHGAGCRMANFCGQIGGTLAVTNKISVGPLGIEFRERWEFEEIRTDLERVLRRPREFGHTIHGQRGCRI